MHLIGTVSEAAQSEIPSALQMMYGGSTVNGVIRAPRTEVTILS